MHLPSFERHSRSANQLTIGQRVGYIAIGAGIVGGAMSIGLAADHAYHYEQATNQYGTYATMDPNSGYALNASLDRSTQSSDILFCVDGLLGSAASFAAGHVTLRRLENKY